jgi:hypothetical protein
MILKKSALILAFSSFMAAPAFAGDITPLHVDGVARSLGASATAMDILYANCNAFGLTVDRAIVRVKDRYPLANPRVRARVAIDTTPTTPCPAAPTAATATTIDYSDSKYATEGLGLLNPPLAGAARVAGRSGFSTPAANVGLVPANWVGTGIAWGDNAYATNAYALGAAYGRKYCLYIDKVPGTVTTTGTYAGRQTTTGTAVGVENYELYAHCQNGQNGAVHVHPAALTYQQNQ